MIDGKLISQMADSPDVLKRENDCPLLHACIQIHRRGIATWTQTMMHAVCHLVDENRRLQKELERKLLTTCEPMVFRKE